MVCSLHKGVFRLFSGLFYEKGEHEIINKLFLMVLRPQKDYTVDSTFLINIGMFDVEIKTLLLAIF